MTDPHVGDLRFERAVAQDDLACLRIDEDARFRGLTHHLGHPRQAEHAIVHRQHHELGAAAVVQFGTAFALDDRLRFVRGHGGIGIDRDAGVQGAEDGDRAAGRVHLPGDLTAPDAHAVVVLREPLQRTTADERVGAFGPDAKFARADHPSDRVVRVENGVGGVRLERHKPLLPVNGSPFTEQEWREDGDKQYADMLPSHRSLLER